MQLCSGVRVCDSSLSGSGSLGSGVGQVTCTGFLFLAALPSSETALYLRFTALHRPRCRLRPARGEAGGTPGAPAPDTRGSVPEGGSPLDPGGPNLGDPGGPAICGVKDSLKVVTVGEAGGPPGPGGPNQCGLRSPLGPECPKLVVAGGPSSPEDSTSACGGPAPDGVGLPEPEGGYDSGEP